MAGLAPTRAADAQELGAVTARACTREFRSVLVPVRDAGARPLGRLHVRVWLARTGRLLHSYTTDTPSAGDAGPGGAEIPPGVVPRGPARPLPYEEREVPGAPGAPAGAPRPDTPDRRAAPQVVVADDGMLPHLHPAGDTLIVDVRSVNARSVNARSVNARSVNARSVNARSGHRAGRARVVVAATGAGACHVALVGGPTVIVLR